MFAAIQRVAGAIDARERIGRLPGIIAVYTGLCSCGAVQPVAVVMRTVIAQLMHRGRYGLSLEIDRRIDERRIMFRTECRLSNR